ncbi:MAG: ATP-binding protein [Alphaproteobacteria bacterium]|nr:ATP-binding protein [Alphaproteobacteria bacterium]
MDDDGIDLLLDALIDLALLIDGERRVLAQNAPARELLGEHSVGRDLALALRHPDALAAADEVLGGAARASRTITLAVPVHQVFELHVTALPARDNQSARALCLLRDVTPAREAERMRADFVANVSHELRSPLASLVGFIETLRGPAQDDAEARARFLDIMDGEAKRMSRLVDDLLSLSRLEAREHIPPTGSVDLAVVLREVSKTVALKAAAKKMTIDLELAPEPQQVPGERDELTEVFDNLIDNAVKYGRPETTVRVRAQLAERIPDVGGAGIAVAVNNRGEPIPPEQLPRLTERFYRIDKGRSRGMGGTGLGLAIVKHIVNHHRGRLIIESDAERGNTFTVFLPLEERAVLSQRLSQERLS